MDEDRIAEAENRCPVTQTRPYDRNPDYYLFKELIRTNVVQNTKGLLDEYKLLSKQHPESITYQYGLALALHHHNQQKQALATLKPLVEAYPDNLYFQLGMADIEVAAGKIPDAVERLQQLQNNNPENYAIALGYAEALLAAKQSKAAVYVLLKASRLFKYDLPLCQKLARAYAANQQKDYAYFTEAQCHLLQGEERAAMHQLKLALSLIKKDKFLRARINAKIVDIKENH